MIHFFPAFHVLYNIAFSIYLFSKYLLSSYWEGVGESRRGRDDVPNNTDPVSALPEATGGCWF